MKQPDRNATRANRYFRKDRYIDPPLDAPPDYFGTAAARQRRAEDLEEDNRRRAADLRADRARVRP